MADNRSLVVKLFIAVVAMFGFGFAMVPLYDVFCEITGFNGKTAGKYEQVATQKVVADRKVDIQFLSALNGSTSIRFEPNTRSVMVNPGRTYEISYRVENPFDYPIVIQAVPSVSPSQLAEYLHKVECFCFNQQLLQAGESVDMPMRFVLDQEFPEKFVKMSLAYTLFDVSEQFPDLIAGAKLASNN